MRTLIISLLLCGSVALGQTHETRNFRTTSPYAQELGDAAEVYRSHLFTYWTGSDAPVWANPCDLSSKDGKASGVTQFSFRDGDVFGWRMQVIGPKDDVLDSVLPHEVNHTVFATMFRTPLPRWLDEGASTLFEHPSDQSIPTATLRQIVGTREWIPMSELMGIRDYPTDGRKLHILYAEGYGFVSYLVETHGPERFVAFIRSGLRTGWQASLQTVYGVSASQLDYAVAAKYRAPHAKSGTKLTAKWFSASWCGPCRQMTPHVEAVRRDGFTITKIEDTGQIQAAGVDRIPTIIIYEDGREISRTTGYQTEAQLRALLNGHIVRQVGWCSGYPQGYTPPQLQRSRQPQCQGGCCPMPAGRLQIQQPMVGIGLPVGPPRIVEVSPPMQHQSVPVFQEQPPQPSPNDLRRLVAEYLQANPPVCPPGPRGLQGPPGESVDPAAVVAAVMSQIQIPRDGVDGKDGADGKGADPAEVARYLIAHHRTDIMGQRGPQGPPGASTPGPAGPIGPAGPPPTDAQVAKAVKDIIYADPERFRGPPGNAGPSGDRYVAIPDDEAFQKRVDEWLSSNPDVVDRYQQIPELAERLEQLERILTSQQPVEVLKSDGTRYSIDDKRRLIDPIQIQMDAPE